MGGTVGENSHATRRRSAVQEDKMNNKGLNLVWGVLLILGGGLFLVQNLGHLEEFSPQVWVVILAGASALFFVMYFIRGLGNWGLLFPACIFAGTAATIWMADSGIDGSVVGAPVIGSVALPFLVAFALDVRKNWWAVIPAFILGAVTLVTAIADQTSGEWIGALVLYAVALPFLVVFITAPRTRRWALIPAYIMVVVGTIPLITDQMRGELIGSFVMFAIALPFLVAFFWDRKHVWGLIVAFILAAVGVIPLITITDFAGEVIGAFVLFSIALPFWAVLIFSRRNWWAAIPAGILTSIGATVLLMAFWDFNDTGLALLNGLMNLGISATFFLVWLQRGTQPVEWAKYPAGAFLVFALITILFGSDMNLYWPILLIGAGLLVLFGSLRPKRSENRST
jgi:hypothetical protein